MPWNFVLAGSVPPGSVPPGSGQVDLGPVESITEVEADTPAGDPEATSSRDEVGMMARGGSLNLIGSLCTQTSLVVITFLLARVLGRAQVGIYAEAYAFFILCGLLAMSGLSGGVTRYVVVHRVAGDTASLRGTIRLALGATTAVSISMGTALFVAAPTLAHVVFHQQALAGPLRYVAAAIPMSTFAQTSLSATQGYRTMKPYALIKLIGEPFVRVGLTGALMAAGLGLRSAMLALVVSNAASAVVGGVVLWRMVGRHHHERPRYRVRQLFGFSMVNWAATLGSAGLLYADTLMLGAMRTSNEVGTYNVATRLVTTASFVMLPINMAFAPQIADLFQRRNIASLRVTYHAATSWIVRISMPAFVALICFPGDLLRLFGRSFAVAAAVTMILAAGKLVDASTGPSGLMMQMIGRPGFQMVNNIGVLALNVGLNLWWIPRWGIIGSALAWAVSLAVVNVARLLQVRWALGIIAFDLSALKGIAAGAGAVAAGEAIRALHLPAELVFGLVGTTGVYLVLLVALRLSLTDRDAWAALRAVGRGRRAPSRPVSPVPEESVLPANGLGGGVGVQADSELVTEPPY